MRRVVAVWFLTLPTDRIRRQSGYPRDTAIVSVERDGNRRLLAAVDAAASRLGLYPGMRLVQAQALVPDLSIHEADPDTDAAVLRRLAVWCLRYGPLTAPAPPDGLWIDATGSTHLWGGEANLLADLIHRLSSRGLSVRAAVADTPALAHAMARFGPDPVCIMPSGAPVPDLPIEALRLPPEVIAGLRLMGFERTSPLAAAARAPLARRFGAILTKRLDQLAGTVFEPIRPLLPDAVIRARLSFVEPLLTAEAFSTVVTRLAGMVCIDLEQAGLGARCLDLLFERVDGSVQALRIRLARPNRDSGHIGRMLDERLEQVDPGLGVDAMQLVVMSADRVNLTQTLTALPDTAAVPDLAPLVDRLANRLNGSGLYRIEPVESDVPERAVRKIPPLPGWRLGSLIIGPDWPHELLRPVRLLEPPQPVDAIALLPDYPPVAFTWRRVHHRVRRADGPERIAAEWWSQNDAPDAVRDYYQVEDADGCRFWLFRRGDGSDAETGDMRWFLHGFF